MVASRLRPPCGPRLIAPDYRSARRSRSREGRIVTAVRLPLAVLLLLLAPLPSALAAPPPVPQGAAWIIDAPGHGGVLLQHSPSAQREIASLTKLMTAHLVLHYAHLGEVVAAGGDAVAVGESSVPLALGERQTVHALLAALIVHSANDAAIVLAHAVMEEPKAQAAAAQVARRLGTGRCPPVPSPASCC